MNMKPNISVPSDVLSIQFVKLSAKLIAPYICKLFNKCVEQGSAGQKGTFFMCFETVLK